MYIQPYLMFDGRCEEAVAFYTEAIGAQLQFQMRNEESPEPSPPGMRPAGTDSKIMHCAFMVGDSLIMASDGYCNGQEKFEGFVLSLTVADEDAAEHAFAALSAGGSVRMPLTKTFWSPCFGMLTDQFGIGWMVTVPGPQA